MSTYTRKDNFGEDDFLDLSAGNFRVALSYESYTTKEFKNDPRYIKWIMRVYGVKDGVYYEYAVPHHLCTEKDYEQFFPIAEKNRVSFERIKNNNAFVCLDFDKVDPVILNGKNTDGDYGRLDL